LLLIVAIPHVEHTKSHERRHRTDVIRTNTINSELLDGRATATDDLHKPRDEHYIGPDAGE
jgi:hypothetical protein